MTFYLTIISAPFDSNVSILKPKAWGQEKGIPPSA